MQRGLFLPAEMREAMRDPDVAEAGLAELRPLDVVGAALSPSPRGDFARVATLESSFYLRNQLLRDTDWAGMAHSLEIRTPLVDSFLLERVAPLFAGALPPNGKSLLAGAPTNPLPDEIVNRDKTGFGVPLRDWFEAMTPGRVKGDEWSRRLWSREWARHALDLYGLGRA
jgi:asparagine synthase (glutamine-hydrolysing)